MPNDDEVFFNNSHKFSYHMLMSRDCALAWKRLQESRPQTPTEDPNTWCTYTKRLYHVPNQPPIPRPSTP